MAIVKKFIEANPHEIVAISFENYTKTSASFDKTLIAAGVDKYALKPSDWDPVKQEGWPTLGWMVENNKRLLLFQDSHSVKTKLAYYIWDYCAATGFGVLDLRYLVSNLRAGADTKPRYLFAAILIPTVSLPLPGQKGLPLQPNYRYDYINGGVLREYIELLQKRYGRIPTTLYIDFLDKGNAF